MEKHDDNKKPQDTIYINVSDMKRKRAVKNQHAVSDYDLSPMSVDWRKTFIPLFNSPKIRSLVIQCGAAKSRHHYTVQVNRKSLRYVSVDEDEKHTYDVSFDRDEVTLDKEAIKPNLLVEFYKKLAQVHEDIESGKADLYEETTP